MLFNILPILAIVVSFGIILFIMFRKLPQASERAAREQKALHEVSSTANAVKMSTQPAVPKTDIAVSVAKINLFKKAGEFASKAGAGVGAFFKTQKSKIGPRSKKVTTSISGVFGAAVTKISSVAGNTIGNIKKQFAQAKEKSEQKKQSNIVQSAQQKRTMLTHDTSADEELSKLADIPETTTLASGKTVETVRNHDREKEMQNARKALFAQLNEEERKQEEEFNVKEKDSSELQQLGELMRSKNNVAKAEEVYIELISRAPKNAQAYIGLGKVYFDQKNYTDAKASFDQAILNESNSAEAYYYVGKIMFEQQALKRAQNAFNQALSWDKKDPEKWFDNGRLLEALGDKEKAMGSYIEAFQLAPSNARIAQELQRVYQELGRADQAKQLQTHLEGLKNTENNGKIDSEISQPHAGVAQR